MKSVASFQVRGDSFADFLPKATNLVGDPTFSALGSTLEHPVVTVKVENCTEERENEKAEASPGGQEPDQKQFPRPSSLPLTPGSFKTKHNVICTR